ncbi:MAG: hypothetical protein JNL32_10385 [Candidatus Kapabacteria bacterium]|nr:hypothetical protein [Candidatus Kapabacteria bacterium]
MRHVFQSVVVVVATAACINTGWAQSGDSTAPKQPVILRHADSLVGTTTANGFVRELMGSVHLEQGNVTVYCDHAYQYIEENRVLLTGSVKIIQGTVTMLMPRGEFYGNQDLARGEGGVTILDRKQKLTANTGYYSTKTLQANFMGAVTVEDDSVRITCDSLSYSRITQQSNCYYSVTMKSKFTDVLILGDSARNVPSVSYSIIRGKVLMLQVDTVKSAKSPVTKSDSANQSKQNVVADSIDTNKSTEFDTLAITSKVLESFRAHGQKRFVATNTVEIVRKNVSAVAEKCIFDNMEETLDLRGGTDSASRKQPVVWIDSTQLNADSMWISLPQKKIRNINAHRNALLAMKDSTLADRVQQITGDALYMTITDDTLRLVRAVDNAKSLYFMTNEQSPDGVSRTTCDSLSIVFEAGELEKIIWRGGVRSEYVPENLVGAGAEKFFLPGYSWLAGRPSMQTIFIPFAERLGLPVPQPSQENPVKQPEQKIKAKKF